MTSPAELPPGFRRGSSLVGGTRLSYLVGGRGPTVVLLHGWPQTAMAWREVLEPLARRGFTVLAPDLRGTGDSDRATDGYAKDDQAEDVRGLVEQLGLTSGVTVVGHDIGAMVAFSWARRYPEEVSRLVVVDVAIPGLGLERAMDVANGGLWHFGLFMQPDVPEMLVSGHETEFFRWWFSTAMPSTLPTAVVDGYARAYSGRESLRAGFRHYRSLLHDGEVNRDWARRGGTLPMPVLAVGGERSAGSRLAGSLRPVAPHVEGAIVEGVGHFVAEDQPQAFLDVLDRFLDA